MNKKLQIVQKYIFSTMLVRFGVLFIYSLIFATPVRSLILGALESNGSANEDGSYLEEHVIRFAQDTSIFANQIMTIAIVGLVLTGIAILYRSHIRKKYYVTNLVSIGALIGYTIGTVGFLFVRLFNYCNVLNSLDLKQIGEDLMLSIYKFPEIEGVGFYHYLGYGIFSLLLVAVIGLIVIYVSKIVKQIKKEI